MELMSEDLASYDAKSVQQVIEFADYVDFALVSRHQEFELFEWRHHRSVAVAVFSQQSEMDAAMRRVALKLSSESMLRASRSGYDYKVETVVATLLQLDKIGGLSAAERSLLDALNLRDAQSALIAVAAPASVDEAWRQLIVHELRHGLFYVDPEFKKYCLDFWSDLAPEVRATSTELLASWGYRRDDDARLANEFQAYLFDAELAPFFQARFIKVGADIEQLRSVFRIGTVHLRASSRFTDLWRFDERPMNQNRFFELLTPSN